MAELDEQWNEIIRPLLAREPSNHVVGDLLGFIGLQRVRVPAFRSAVEHALAKSARRLFDQLPAEGEMAPPAEFPDLADRVVFKIDPHQSIHAMSILLKSMGPVIESFGYTVLHNETSLAFITTDNPVAYYSVADEKGILPYRIVPSLPRELLFPISPDTMILGRSSDRSRYASKGLKHVRSKDENQVRRINRIIARFGYEALFSKTPLPISFTERYSQQSPVLDPHFPGYVPEAMTLPPFVFGTRAELPKWDRNKDYRLWLPGLSE